MRKGPTESPLYPRKRTLEIGYPDRFIPDKGHEFWATVLELLEGLKDAE